MQTPRIPEFENARLKVVQSLDFLNQRAGKEVEDIIELTSKFMNVPIVLISIIREDVQEFYIKKGIDDDSTPRAHSFCAHAILQPNELMVVSDAHQDARFSDNPMVIGDPFVCFYAGKPLIVKGQPIGTLCAIDHRPRELKQLEGDFLDVMGHQVESIMLQKDFASNYIKLINQYEQQTALLENHINSLKDTISAISHDAIGPVRTIKSLVELSKSDSSIPVMDFVDQMDSSLQDSETFLNKLLQWGIDQLRSENSGGETISLLEVTREIARELRPAIARMNNEFQFPNDDLFVKADRNKILFVLRNLVKNAARFTENGIIRISWEKNEVLSMIMVEDNGSGISPEKLRSLNQGNNQNSESNQHGEKGNGLGLQLCFRFIERMNGKMVFDSREGQGTKVWLSIPSA